MRTCYFVTLLAISIAGASCAEKNSKKISVADSAERTAKPATIAYLSQDSLKHYVAECPAIKPNAKARVPFRNLAYDKVIAYLYDGVDGESITLIVQQEQLASTILRQQCLSQRQVNEITDLLGAPTTYGEAPAFCFLPHFGFVFFRGTKIKASINISLPCNHLYASPTIPATEARRITISKGATYLAEGFSQAGGAKLTRFIKELGFPETAEWR